MTLIKSNKDWNNYRQNCFKTVNKGVEITENIQDVYVFPVLVNTTVNEKRGKIRHVIVDHLQARQLLTARKNALLDRAQKIREELKKVLHVLS